MSNINSHTIDFNQFNNMATKQQSTNHIQMVWSPGFRSNIETIETNFAQNSDKFLNPDEISNITEKAKQEFDNLKKALESHGVQVDTLTGSINSPDCIFPNNTFSTHSYESTVVFYPMLAENRQAELDEAKQIELASNYQNTLNLREYRDKEQILEGTGSLVLDRVNKIAYAVNSPRTDSELVKEWGEKMGYQTICFDALDSNENEVYHTNVVMWIGSYISGICLDSIPDEESREGVRVSLEHSGKTVLAITKEQMDAPNFAGNALEVLNSQSEPILAMSDAAWNAYTPEQQETLNEFYPAGIIHEPIPTIEEFGGGSVRCMLAEIF